MVSTRTTKQNIGLIISLPILVAAVSVCSHLSIALADSGAYEEAHVLVSSDEIARYIGQSPIQGPTTSMSEQDLDLVKHKTEVFTFEGNNRVQITYDISTKVTVSSDP